MLPTLLLADMLAGNRGHLVADDLFLSECIAPLTREFLVVTSTTIAKNIRDLGLDTWEFPPRDQDAFLQRPMLFRLMLSLPCARFNDVVFQSFEELSVLLFMLRHPFKRVHLIVTNNLRPDRLKRHPILGRFFLRLVFQRAASVIVHCQHEVTKVRELAPRLDPSRIFIKPFHQLAAPRTKLSWHEKSPTILFLGPELTHKKVTPVVELIKRDTERRYRYVFCSMKNDMAFETQAFLEKQANVDLLFGYLEDDEYYRLFSESALIMLTHDDDFEGTLSGAFCDAIASGTPIIACDMAPHNEFFERFGKMGFLVDFDDPGWCNRVLSADLAVRYREFQENMAACRESCSMESIREVFRAVFARLQSKRSGCS